MKKIPKSVDLILHKGIGLSYEVPGGTQDKTTKQWTAIFYGGTKTFKSEIVPSESGCPEWNTEVVMDLKNAKDPIIIKVKDFKEREIGQAIINLESIEKQENFDLKSSYLKTQVLNPTKKNSYPKGSISFWINAKDFWPDDVKIPKSISLKNSLSNLSIFNKPKNDNTSESSFSLSSKFKQLRKRSRQPNTSNFSGSILSDYSRNGVSRNSSFQSNSRTAGWTENQKAFNADTYNPMEGGNENSSSGKKSGFSNLTKMVSKSTHNLFENHFKSSRKNSEADLSSHATREEFPSPALQKEFEITKANPIGNMMDIPPLEKSMSPKISKEMSNMKTDGIFMKEPTLVDRPNKHITELNRQELLSYVENLESKNKSLNEKVKIMNRKNDDLKNEIKLVNEELNDTRNDLLNLKNKLLGDGMTKYLEVQFKNEIDVPSLLTPYDSKSTAYYSGNEKSQMDNSFPVKQEKFANSVNNFISITDIHHSYWQ